MLQGMQAAMDRKAADEEALRAERIRAVSHGAEMLREMVKEAEAAHTQARTHATTNIMHKFVAFSVPCLRFGGAKRRSTLSTVRLSKPHRCHDSTREKWVGALPSNSSAATASMIRVGRCS